MGRSRSRSPRRRRSRSRSPARWERKGGDRHDEPARRRSRSRSRERRRSRSRDRSRSPRRERRRSRSREAPRQWAADDRGRRPSPPPSREEAAPRAAHDARALEEGARGDEAGGQVDDRLAAEEDDPEAAMMRLMGFSGFNSTKGKEVDDPNAKMGAVFQKSVRRARQYMNRKGGFNRPLPKEVTGRKHQGT